MTKQADVTLLLGKMREGDQAASNDLFNAIYPHLKRLAAAQRYRWSGDYTLSSTALINEAYMKLANANGDDWKDRVHFFRVASLAMRQILQNYRAKKTTGKRGSGMETEEYDDTRVAAVASAERMVRVQEILDELKSQDPRLVAVFECRRVGGLSISETAAELDLSESTVKRDSKFIEAWIKDALKESVVDEID
ncbi:MAG: ECF-type sigma factor [Pseudomonadota bacterium]